MHQTCCLAMKAMKDLPYTLASFTCRLQAYTHPRKQMCLRCGSNGPATFIRVVDASVCPGSLGSLKAGPP